jgi:hypothetical protein
MIPDEHDVNDPFHSVEQQIRGDGGTHWSYALDGSARDPPDVIGRPIPRHMATGDEMLCASGDFFALGLQVISTVIGGATLSSSVLRFASIRQGLGAGYKLSWRAKRPW